MLRSKADEAVSGWRGGAEVVRAWGELLLCVEEMSGSVLEVHAEGCKVA